MTTQHATEAYYQAKIAGLEARVHRVRREHWHDGGTAVSGCEADGEAYPCTTIRALDGE